jgi:hypothetical protein
MDQPIPTEALYQIIGELFVSKVVADKVVRELQQQLAVAVKKDGPINVTDIADRR